MSKTLREDELQGTIIHVYDGIEEADNRLPRWWLATFYITIAFSAYYWIHHHVFKLTSSPVAAYEEAVEKTSGSVVSEEDLLAAAADPKIVEEGKALFATHCTVCHEADGRGKIGPNLTDEYWIHGGSVLDQYNVVTNGVVTKGMPPWGPTLGTPAVKKIMAFALSIRNTNVTGGKEAQGERWSKKPAAQDSPQK